MAHAAQVVGAGEACHATADNGDLLAAVFTRGVQGETVLQAIKDAGVEPQRAGIEKHAETTVPLQGAKAQQLFKLLEALDDNDDVQHVWANFDISEKDLEEAAAG